ncbi:MAG: bifunctional phosphopantothenoylcysteine decarboxylase/phosphopantothenate--cysteine ligase CoaBC [Alphaproteobacteria bacterium]|nr:bifunctional phosphopantothenoylcysteine decarboxylase/phosphopantothenate--cysteine ligase CoaBC [Alphaproteobacteria bacterium]
MIENRRILLVVSGGIAAYKSLDLARELRRHGATVRAILTEAGARFVTPLSLAALTGDKVYGDLFSLTDESEMGHIRLSREADLVLVAPATADILAKMAHGLATDLATTALLATDKPVMVAPAMNVRMWEHAATRANMATLAARDVTVIAPAVGEMACGEEGEGRLADVSDIVAAVEDFFDTAAALGAANPTEGGSAAAPLRGRRAVVTSGPTHEPLDPVRFIGNRSSGKQGHAIAAALARLGADTVLVSGPVALPDPVGVSVVHAETAEDMLRAVSARLPVDVAVMAAAVGDWRAREVASHKIKKRTDRTPPRIELAENPDILAAVAAAGNKRPRLVIGFAAETEDVIAQGRAKRAAKGCDWIVANDVSPGTSVFGGDENTVHLIRGADEDQTESWPRLSKDAVAARLADAVARHFAAVP